MVLIAVPFDYSDIPSRFSEPAQIDELIAELASATRAAAASRSQKEKAAPRPPSYHRRDQICAPRAFVVASKAFCT
ncbi:hypothetical protein AS026_07715 [Rhizobium altiplani]|uniref:Uncharacterized protein n=1 Tax=Rhizobium altiplani TaxID=1864509 RepID=A0A109JKW6_9HYPH|nr:hypothetical protein AS026_07715 [Rhizobium altiplani]